MSSGPSDARGGYLSLFGVLAESPLEEEEVDESVLLLASPEGFFSLAVVEPVEPASLDDFFA